MAMDDKTVTAKVPAQQLDNGIEPAGSNISEEFYFGDDVTNIHKAQYDGFGPRYGMAPIPYHSCDWGALTYSLPSLERTVASGSGDLRRLVFGVFPLRLAAYSADGPLGSTDVYYAWIGTGISASVPEIIINSGAGASSPRLPLSKLDISLSLYSPWQSAPDTATGQWVPLISGAPSTSTRRLLGSWSKLYASTALMTVPGRIVQMEYFLSTVTAQAAGSIPPIGTLQFYGYSSEFAYLNQTSGARNIRVMEVRRKTAPNQQTTRFAYLTAATGPYYLYRSTYGKSTADFDSSKLSYSSAVTYGTGVSGDYAASATFALYVDSQAKHNQRHSLVTAAFGKAYAWIYKEEMNSTITTAGVSQTLPLIPVDLTSFRYSPIDVLTTNQGTANPYTENGSAKQTCWGSWPSFAFGTALPNDFAMSSISNLNNVSLGAVDSGILRKETVYEFAYSVYNKLLGHETNVGTPTKIETGSDDFVCLYLRRSQTDTGASTGNNLAYTAGSQMFVQLANYNYYEYRVYYRAFGSFEWLPAGKTDAAKYYFDSSERVWGVCQGAIAGLPGGQPGGYIDNSPLPDDEYFQTFTYEDRLFWVSPKSIVFSPRSSPYTYAVTSALGCPNGSFLGAIAHAYPGQAQQGSRIVIFGTKETYTARFLGEQFAINQPVRVSPDFVGTFPLDGSDFTIEPWTSITAFSYRSAVNAKGVLYWWGPEGIFRDDGVDVPGKEWSGYMDPYLKTIYDKNSVDKIHSVYNTNTHEVIWFYLDTAGAQKALVYNTKADSFFNFTFSNILIDASQILEVVLVPTENAAKRSGIQGNRVSLMCRDASDPSGPQRAVFFDELVDGGDLRIYRIAMCTGVAINGANRRLTITVSNAGYTLPGSGLATISSYNQYADPAAARDVEGIYSIVGSDGSTYIDIAPIGGAWPAANFELGSISFRSRFFPVHIEAENGFSLRAKSEYFSPMGWLFHGRWIYCQQLFRVDQLIKSSGYQVKMEWLTTAGGATPGIRTLTLSDNYRGNYRVHSQIPFTQQNAEGQGISTTWTTPSGLHNGGRWFVQYLSFNIVPMSSGENRRYEG